MTRAPRRPRITSPEGEGQVTTLDLLARVVAILEAARVRTVRAVNSEMVLAYWHIGREIVEEVQRGAGRAEYGEAVLDTLSKELTARFGRGFSGRNLRYFREFYLAFADRTPEIWQSSISKSSAATSLGETTPREGFASTLSWGHYRTLSKVDEPAARAFYEAEAESAGWTVEVLERQIHTQLFTSLPKSRDKDGVLALARHGQRVERPIDVIRDPYVLDFLDLPDGGRFRESDIEGAIIDGLQNFLLELGKGFAFVGRQRRLEYDDEVFYVDLVFYNCILKCYLLIDLKMGRLTHQDVGQMDSYVRLFDDKYTTEGDHPTIGLILCAVKNEAVARYSVLHESEQLFAARYVTLLPTVEELQAELLRERRLLESRRRTR